jgi:hypothetical protein
MSLSFVGRRKPELDWKKEIVEKGSGSDKLKPFCHFIRSFS